ncbi:MAG: hypothetical protein H7249_12350, partial [Chitinophagaceae bacterium]|nr:hypothetical protein [Oligoflexus sp.]
MNLDPKNYVALLDSIIRTNPSLLDTIRTILKAYLKLDPYEDLLGQMPPKLQATLLYIIQDINDIENPFTLEQEVFFLLEHLNHVQHDIDGVIGAEDEGESEGGHDAKAVKPKKAKAKPAAVKKKPAAVKKKPAVVKKKPAVVKKKPAVVKKKPAVVKKKPAVVKKKPAVVK